MTVNRPPSLAVNTVVNDRYQVASVVGQGGLGTVYQVRDSQGGIYALKETFDLSEGAVEQFEREAKWLAKLDHPHIPKVREYFQWHDRLYLIMDFFQGENLEQKLIRGGYRPLDEADVLGWILPICDALNYLHTQHPPIVHRDVKPANIIVSPAGNPALVDLGIAKEHIPGLPNLTATFIRKSGTEGYAPPEQYTSNGKTGPWSDIYSLGATLYHLLTGHVPASAIERAALDGQLIAPRKLNPLLSIEAESVIMTALAIRPQDRFATMSTMLEAIDCLIRGIPFILPASGGRQAKSKSSTNSVPQVTCPRCGRVVASNIRICPSCLSELSRSNDPLADPNQPNGLRHEMPITSSPGMGISVSIPSKDMGVKVFPLKPNYGGQPNPPVLSPMLPNPSENSPLSTRPNSSRFSIPFKHNTNESTLQGRLPRGKGAIRRGPSSSGKDSSKFPSDRPSQGIPLLPDPSSLNVSERTSSRNKSNHIINEHQRVVILQIISLIIFVALIIAGILIGTQVVTFSLPSGH
jgi:serine/threonine protein kinase